MTAEEALTATFGGMNSGGRKTVFLRRRFVHGEPDTMALVDADLITHRFHPQHGADEWAFTDLGRQVFELMQQGA